MFVSNNIGEDTRLDIYHRNNIIHWSCKAYNILCIENVKNLFNEFMVNDINVPVDIRPAIYCTALRVTGRNEFDFLWQKYMESNVPTERVVILNALGCTTHSDLLKVYLLSN